MLETIIFLNTTVPAGLGEYVDCNSPEGQEPPPNQNLWYDIKLHQIVRLFYWSLVNVEYAFINITTMSTMNRSGSTC